MAVGGAIRNNRNSAFQALIFLIIYGVNFWKEGNDLYESRIFMKDLNKEMVYFIDFTIITWAVLFVNFVINL